MNHTPETVGILGYGEVGRALTARMVDRGIGTVVTNRNPDDLRETVTGSAVGVAPDPTALASESDFVVSCVWPETALDVAKAAAPGLAGTVYVDLNSVASTTVECIHDVVGDAGGEFVNGSIMNSVSRHGADVPLAVSGPAVETGASQLRALGFTVEPMGPDPIRVAVLKMCRSAVTKGLLSLFVEALLPARRHDVHEEVLESIDDSFRDITLGEFIRYFLVDMTEHGERRAGELEEVIATFRGEGFDATMSEQTRRLSQTMGGISTESCEMVLEQLESIYRDDAPGDDSDRKRR